MSKALADGNFEAAAAVVRRRSNRQHGAQQLARWRTDIPGARKPKLQHSRLVETVFATGSSPKRTTAPAATCNTAVQRTRHAHTAARRSRADHGLSEEGRKRYWRRTTPMKSVATRRAA